MTTNKLIWCAIVGGVLILLASIGCGSVNTYGLDSGVTGEAGAAVVTGAAGDSPDGSVRGDRVGATGGGGAGGAAGGAAERPLGAGCVDDSQCGSKICAKSMPSATSGMCCDGRPDACNTCVGGYKTPGADGSSCGASICDGPKHMVPGESAPWPTVAKWSTCHAGTCVMQTADCTQVFTCADGAQMNFGDPGFCDNTSATIRCLEYSGTSFVSCSSLGHGEMR
jgi:hypothetical protein